jgi:PIN domain nuclease of toxin-antitoxin system
VGKEDSPVVDPVVVLDAGALIAFERRNEAIRALIQRALLRSQTRKSASPGPFFVPAGVLGQVIRNRQTQVQLRAFLSSSLVHVVPLDRALAEACGMLCAQTNTRDVIDASVVLVAKQHDALVVTSDPMDLQRLDPTLRVAVV